MAPTRDAPPKTRCKSDPEDAGQTSPVPGLFPRGRLRRGSNTGSPAIIAAGLWGYTFGDRVWASKRRQFTWRGHEVKPRLGNWETTIQRFNACPAWPHRLLFQPD